MDRILVTNYRFEFFDSGIARIPAIIVMSSIVIDRYVEMRLRNKLVEEIYEIVKFRLLTEYLSPVRDQDGV